MTSAHRTPFIGGNWKMNTNACQGAALIQALACGCCPNSVEVAVFPPMPYLSMIAQHTNDSSIAVGAQNFWHEGNGAYTGEVSIEMLKDCGATTALTGHSERRHIIGESDELINLKTKAAIAGGIQVVLCIGETLEQRQAGQTDQINESQIRSGLDGVSKDDLGSVVIAYEPVWAIGTGKTATPEDAQSAHASIRGLIAQMYDQQAADAIRIIYGGSMKPNNANELIAMPDIDGGLIGGASLKAEDFLAIIEAGTPSPA